MSFFSSSDAEAEGRFKQYFEVDPFDDIPPALLNSSDIRSYVGATGMVFPFSDDDKKFKTASYEVDLLGKCVYWDGAGNKVVQQVKEGDEFVLRKNSIAFVTLRPMLRLPQYIAIRFNLKITHVYRGILLGTGPLVDPGYRNRLSIPLHNLTNNDYVFKGGEGLIWMEFTKLSHTQPVGAVSGPLPPKWSGEVAKFPEPKNKLGDVEDYIRKGEPHRPVRSSIPEVFHDSEKAAQGAVESIRNFRRLALGAAAITVIFGLFPIVSLVHDVNNTVTATKEQLDTSKRDLEEVKKKLSLVEEQLKERVSRQERADAELERLRALVKAASAAPAGSPAPAKKAAEKAR
jgi:deoxycytidine triphosphate deaminase